MIRRLLNESIIYGLGIAATSFIGVLLIPVYTRVFTPTEYGLLDILLTTSVLLVLLSGLQVESGVARSFFERKKEKKDSELVGKGLLIQSISCICVICIGGLLFHFWIQTYHIVQWVQFLPVLLIILPSAYLTLIQIILRLEQKTKMFLILSVGDAFTTAIFSIIAVVFFKFGISGALWALLFSKILWASAGLIWFKNFYNFHWNFNFVKEILHYSVPTMPSTLINWGQSFANRFILVGSLALSDVGIFGLATRIASFVTLFITAFRMAWYPYALEIMNNSDCDKIYAQMLDYYFIVGFTVCALTGAFGDILIKIFATNAYLQSARLIGFLCMGLFWTGALEILVMGIDIVRKTYLSIFGFFAGFLVNMILLFATLNIWGVAAASFSFLMGAITMAVLMLYISQSQFYVPYRYSVFGIMVISSIIFATLDYFSPYLLDNVNSLVFNDLILGTITLIFCFLLSLIVFNQEDKKKIFSFVKTFTNKIFL